MQIQGSSVQPCRGGEGCRGGDGKAGCFSGSLSGAEGWVRSGALGLGLSSYTRCLFIFLPELAAPNVWAELTS